MIIQQCAEASNAWDWYYELIAFMDLDQNIELSHEEMQKIVATNTITLGTEFGANRGNTFDVKKGTNTYRCVVISSYK